MSEIYVAPIPECPQHGQMHLRLVTADGQSSEFAYVCHGFDGEGCDHVVWPAGQEWTHVGRTEGSITITFTAPLDSPNARIALGGEP